MRFIGSTVWDHLGKPCIKVRNKTQIFVEVPEKTLTLLGNPRYVEFYQDFAGQIWVRRPAGKQVLLQKPFRIIQRFNGSFTYQDFP